jgi:hypothetical protein
MRVHRLWAHNPCCFSYPRPGELQNRPACSSCRSPGGNDNGQNPGAHRYSAARYQQSAGHVRHGHYIDTAEAIQIEYKFNPKWSVSGTRDQNSGFGVDERYRKDF